ncbi:MAG TPA: PA14 domain-containing protein, partial [Chryseosolibacter sp.]|nr:PA14 domain-containing protein [Chryseosolibacter sp.]
IRAVGNAGRSNYTPSSSTQYLVVVTAGDSQNPSVPQNLTAEASGIREIKLQWQAASDNTGIKEYLIYYGSQVVATGSPATTFKLTNLPLNANFTFFIRAKDLGNNLSGASNTASATTFVTGLFYEHTTGAFSDIDLINWSIAEYEGRVNNFTLSRRTQEDYFNFNFEGFLYINQGGSYQFQTTSDDGSRMTIDNTIVVDNDGQHGTRTITGQTVALSAGARLINVKYFDYNGGQSLTVRYKGPDTGNAWVSIPDAALRSGQTSSASTMLVYDAQAAENIVATDDVTERLRTDLYPNPLRPNDGLFLRVKGTDEPMRIRLMDAMGKSYYDVTLPSQGYSGDVEIVPQEQLANGIYILTIEQGGQTKKQTLIVRD